MIKTCSPLSPQAEYGAEVDEDWSPGTHVLDVVAHCRAAVSYRLVSGNEDDAFLLNPGAGVLTVNERLDYERRTWYNLSVQAVSTVGGVSGGIGGAGSGVGITGSVAPLRVGGSWASFF